MQRWCDACDASLHIPVYTRARALDAYKGTSVTSVTEYARTHLWWPLYFRLSGQCAGRRVANSVADGLQNACKPHNSSALRHAMRRSCRPVPSISSAVSGPE